jgi:GGDEF domain-containing protein
MIPTRWLLALLGGLFTLGIAPIVVNLISQKLIDREFKPLDAIDFYFGQTFIVAIWAIFLFAIVIGGIIVLFNRAIESRNLEIADLMAQLTSRDNTISAIKGHLHDARQIQFLDMVTGIPNEAKWIDDIDGFATKASIDTPRQVALIDLVDFGRLNHELGYGKVDEILRFLAQSLDESMRKSEGLYRRPLDDNGMLPKDAMSPNRIYRKYPGGDEFYVVAEGSEASMLGLLTRLQRLITTRLDKHISDNIAKAPIQIRFSGGVCQLYRGEKADRLTQRLVDCLRPTRYPNATRRLNWESGKRSVDFEVGSTDRNLYEQAELEFSRTPS